jgi:hypothetical protein
MCLVLRVSSCFPCDWAFNCKNIKITLYRNLYFNENEVVVVAFTASFNLSFIAPLAFCSEFSRKIEFVDWQR